MATDTPAVESPPLSPGQLLSARERAVMVFRDRMNRETTLIGTKRAADHVAGYRAGWDAAVQYLRMQGEPR